jgi:hypothetical protein
MFPKKRKRTVYLHFFLLQLLVALGLQKKAVLTYVGRGAFKNEDGWIAGAIKKALDALSGSGLDVVINEYKKDDEMRKLCAPQTKISEA